LSREEDFEKVEAGLKILQLNFQRIADKFGHLNQTVGYLGDELVMFKNNLQRLNEQYNQLKTTRQEQPEKTPAKAKRKGGSNDVND